MAISAVVPLELRRRQSRRITIALLISQSLGSATERFPFSATTRRFGTILENVDLDPATRELDLDSERFTENTRGAYPLEFIGNADPTGMAGHPRNVVLLTADAFGVLPPISRLTPEQVRDFYSSSYPEITTASIEGPEVVDGVLNALHAVGFFLENHLDEEVARAVVVLEVRRVLAVARHHLAGCDVRPAAIHCRPPATPRPTSPGRSPSGS